VISDSGREFGRRTAADEPHAVLVERGYFFFAGAGLAAGFAAALAAGLAATFGAALAGALPAPFPLSTTFVSDR
jgi:hypothetical protein